MAAGPGGGAPRLLAATDLSARSDRALRRAALVAARLGAELLLLHVLDEEQPASLLAIERAEVSRLLAAQLAGLPELAGARCRPVIEPGDPHAAILRAAEREAALALVLGEPRRGGLRELVSGTTVERVLRGARAPVLTVRRPPAGPYRRVLLATDFSAGAEEAARAAERLGLLAGAEAHAVHALVPPRLGALADKALAGGAAAGLATAARAEAQAALTAWAGRHGAAARLCEGPAAQVVAALVAELDAELLVVGTRGQGRLRQALLGSVAAELLAAAPCDLLAVPPG